MSDRPSDEVELECVISVPGCTCAERSQSQLDRADVCQACVNYFDMETE